MSAFLHGHALPAASADAAAHAPQNSNLVLTAETRTRDAAEPSGEPDSLWGRMKGKMGDRVHYNQPEELVDRKAKAKKKCVPGRQTQSVTSRALSQTVLGSASCLTACCRCTSTVRSSVPARK